MKRLFILLTIMVAALFPVNSYAWDPPASPKPASAILDQAGVLSDADHQKLDSQLKRINSSSANEIAVLILPTLDGEAIDDVGIATAKAWGVGKKDLDNGVLVVLAMKEHKYRIETGKGVEGDLPDLKCNDILANVLRPYMKKGDVAGGLTATIDAIASTIANHKSDVASGNKHSSSCQVSQPGVDVGWVFLGLIFLAFIVLGLRIVSRKREQEQPDWGDQDDSDDDFEEESEEPDESDDEHQKQMLAEIERSEREAARKAAIREEEIRQREAQDALTPVVAVPVMPKQTPSLKSSHIKSTVVAAASTVTLAALEAERHAREAREREEESRRRREAQERDDERRRRQQEDDDERRRRSSESSSSSSSSFDWGGSSSGGDFGGGDFGGGGSSSDW